MDCPLMWLTGDLCQRKGPKLDLVHRISMPTGTSAPRSLLDKAEGILHENIGPAILAWSSMYGLNLYSKWMDDLRHFFLPFELRHFNLPVFYGRPTAGKILIAQCAAWMNGCSELQIASKYLIS